MKIILAENDSRTCRTLVEKTQLHQLRQRRPFLAHAHLLQQFLDVVQEEVRHQAVYLQLHERAVAASLHEYFIVGLTEENIPLAGLTRGLATRMLVALLSSLAAHIPTINITKMTAYLRLTVNQKH